MQEEKLIKANRGYGAREVSDSQEKVRVAAYCRVSTDDEEQLVRLQI